jgi:beta-phosphoglucomutase family hydrolase
MIQAFIFDMDGTLIDSTKMDYEAWQRAMREYDAEFPYEEYIAKLGAKGSEIARQYLDISDEEIDALISRREEYFKQIVEEKGLSLLPHAEQFLQQLRNAHLKTALATGANQEKLEFIFEKLPLRQYFDAFVTANDVSKGKPDPEVFVQAAAKLGIDPAHCVVMEDATNGLQAAKNGGMRCIALTTTRGAEQLQGADLIVSGYAEIDLLHWLEEQQSQEGSAM